MKSFKLFLVAACMSMGGVFAQNCDVEQVVCLMNQYRSSAGAPPLGISSQLSNSAQQHSNDQAKMGQMTHNGSNGSDPGTRIGDSGYKGNTWGENVAGGYYSGPSCLQGLMNSAPHRENILDPKYTAVGMGCANGYWTQDFGGGDNYQVTIPNCGGSQPQQQGENHSSTSKVTQPQTSTYVPSATPVVTGESVSYITVTYGAPPTTTSSVAAESTSIPVVYEGAPPAAYTTTVTLGGMNGSNPTPSKHDCE